MDFDNKISKDKNILFVFSYKEENASEELIYLIKNFCGKVVKNPLNLIDEAKDKRIYVCGNIDELKNKTLPLNIIKELSFNVEHYKNENAQIIALGKVPVLVENAGVYFRRLFDEDDYFNKIKNEHEFQHLTESNKQGRAFRKGIYLTEILKEESKEEKEVLHFRLLRCSSNLTGPTDNFRKPDQEIIQTLNEAAKYVFENETSLNHVLAQIYENKKVEGIKNKETKARIKAHSDKTKDMLSNGLIAFCTFYDKNNFQELKPSSTDRYDWCYKNKSGLTRLFFKLKKTVNDETLAKEFTVVLYPNSVFIIPLSINRLYTHEIRPSMLNVDRIPIRMGYVVRCSKTESLFMDDQTYIKENGALIKLEEITPETRTDLRNSYYEENKTENMVEYGKVHFSMNKGDYQKPIY